MPELTQFCNYVRQHFVKISSDDDKEKSRENTDVEIELTWLFNGRQLIEMFSLFDLADVVSHLIQSIHSCRKGLYNSKKICNIFWSQSVH